MEVLTVEEAAVLLKLNPETVYRKARKGEIPAVKVGRSWRFPKEPLEEWLREEANKRVGRQQKQKQKQKQRAKETPTPRFKSYKMGEIKGSLSRREIYSDR